MTRTGDTRRTKKIENWKLKIENYFEPRTTMIWINIRAVYKHSFWGGKRGEKGRKICPTAWDNSKAPL